MTGRRLAVALLAVVLLAAGAAVGWALHGTGAGATRATEASDAVSPVPASPAVPGAEDEPYAADIDAPALPPGLTYERHRTGSKQYGWSYAAPAGWVPQVIGPGETTWTPPGVPEGGYGLRIKVVSARLTPSAMVEQKLVALQDAVDDVELLGRTPDSLAITFRAQPSNRLRLNTFRWFVRPGRADAQLEVSVNGRGVDAAGLDDLLDQVAASTAPL